MQRKRLRQYIMNSPAKINLYLHIVGHRDDHYHLLESIFVFTQWGDDIAIMPRKTITLSITGPSALPLKYFPLEQNLCYRAAILLQKKFNIAEGAHIILQKNIPVSAGLGGGSSNAATVLKLLNQQWKLNLSQDILCELGATIGADVPACIHATSAFVSGVGEKIQPITLSFAGYPVLLVNPNQPLSTQKVFQQFHHDAQAFTPSQSYQNTLEWISKQRNDLEKPAMQLQPAIRAILEKLEQQPSCKLARMSGSGPTCFGIFETVIAAENAKLQLQKQFPLYWMKATVLC